MSTAAIVDEIGREVADTREIGPIDDRPALTEGRNQPRPAEMGEVRRHGVWRHIQQAGDFPRRSAGRLPFYEKPQHAKARGLGERREGIESNR